MSSFSEEKQLPTLIWSNESYTLSEFIDQHSLPQVVRVETGFHGGTDVPTLEVGEVFALHALRKTHKLTAEDSDGNTIEIALNCPYRLQILPQEKKCKLNRCGVSELPSIYPKVKYLEVTAAHYGTDVEDDTSVGEILEILSVHKHHKKVDVKNVKSGQTFTLSFHCTAQFRPLRDWRNYCAKDIKTQFGFPTKARFLDTNGNDSKLVSKTPNVNVVGEIEEVLVIATTVTKSVRLKFCYEIPKDLEIEIAVAKGSVKGQRYYQELVENLHNRFDLSKFVSVQDMEYLKYRQKTIIEYDYESIKNIFRSISSEESASSNQNTYDDVRPALPPRHSIRRTKSTEDINPSSKPAIAPKPPTRRTRSESVPVQLANVSKMPQEIQGEESRRSKNHLQKSQKLPMDGRRVFPKLPPNVPSRSPGVPNFPLGSHVDPDPEIVRRQWSGETKPCPQNNDDKNWPGAVGSARAEDNTDQIYESPTNMDENRNESSSTYMELQNNGRDAVTASEDHAYQSYIKITQREPPPVSEPEIEDDPYVEISMIPEDLSSLSIQDVSRMLRNLGIGCYVQRFEEEMIDGNMLMSLNKSELESLDVSSFHITKLIKFINGWRPKH